MKKKYIPPYVRFAKKDMEIVLLAGSFAAAGLDGLDGYNGDGQEEEDID